MPNTKTTKTIKTTEGSERKLIATVEEWKLIRDFTRYIKATKNKAAIQAVLGEVQTHSSCSHVIQNTWITECPICYGKKFHFIMSFEGDAAPGVFGGIKCCTCGFGAGTVMKKTPRFFSHQLLSGWSRNRKRHSKGGESVHTCGGARKQFRRFYPWQVVPFW